MDVSDEGIAGSNDTAYAVTAQWLADALSVQVATGLTAAEIDGRRAEFGANVIETAHGTPLWQILLNQVRGAVVWLLIGAAGLSLWLGDLAEAVAILIVLLINTLIGFVTEARATKSMEALRQLTRTAARVRREGRETWIDAADLVPGDVVLLDAGDVVPADLRLVEAADLHVDESTLTGESVPVTKSTDVIPGKVSLA
ncbi:MAG: HAD-IC family P-type ATPase, partial [Pseudomonadota bacterium]